MIRVVIADDQCLVRTGFRMILDETPMRPTTSRSSARRPTVSPSSPWLPPPNPT
jgi:DNA-binding NarL/FixJ family response regulator